MYNDKTKKLIEYFIKHKNHKIHKKDLYQLFLEPKKNKSQTRNRRELEKEKIQIEECIWILENYGLVKTDRISISILDKFDFKGSISLTKKGDGFLSVGPDLEIFIPSKFTESALNGDQVLVVPLNIGKKNRIEGKVVKVLKRGRTLYRMKVQNLEGKFIQGYLLDMSGEEKFALIHKKSILKDVLDDISIHDVLIVKLKEHAHQMDDSYEFSFVKLEKGKTLDLDLNRILMKYNLEQNYPDTIEFNFPESVNENSIHDWEQRVDLRDLYTITIDGETAKDFDDAISFVEEDKKIIFYIHIADVSYYVKQGSALDEEAKTRATSVYLANRVVPMLPPQLSENLCSLIANENRLAFTVEMEGDYKGKIYSAKFYKSIIKVNERYTYERAEKELNESSSSNWLNKVMRLANSLKQSRIEQGRIELSFNETYIKADKEDPKVFEILKRERLNSHILIEEMMLSANTKVAEFLRKKKAKTLYRIHESMDEDKLENINNLLKLSGLKTRIKTVEYTDLKKALSAIQGKPLEKIFNYNLLRSFMQAVYNGEPKGHWGLGFRDYCHFTSPIRRYPDLVCHRALYEILDKEEDAYTEEEIHELGFHCSKEERRAADAERDIMKLKACRFVHDSGKKEFTAVITGFKPTHVFVELEEVLAEGVIRYTEFTNDLELTILDDFSFYAKKYSKTFSLGDKLNLELENIDFEEIRIYLKIKKPNKGKGL
jgi:ribonuclease R